MADTIKCLVPTGERVGESATPKASAIVILGRIASTALCGGASAQCQEMPFDGQLFRWALI